MLEEGGGGRVQRQGGSPGAREPSMRSGDGGCSWEDDEGPDGRRGSEGRAAGDREPGTMERTTALPRRRRLVDTC